MEWITLPGPVMDALAALLVFAVAYALIRIGLLQYSMLAPSDADAVPLLHVLAILTGGLLGLLLLATLPHAEDFRLSRIFAADSPWNLGVGGFLARHALPDGATIRAARDALFQEELTPGSLAGWAGLALALIAAVQAVLLWRGWSRLRAVLAVLLLAFWTALVLHYVAHLVA
ncbi:MAG: hypothetical protein WCP77_20980, partial [Roseococcus sp.]